MKKSYAPRVMASLAISRVPWAVITMMGVSGARSRQRGMASSPSMSGSFTSRRIRSHAATLSVSRRAPAVGATSTS